MTTILEEADRITSNDRRHSYGHPLDNFSDTALIVTGILHATGKLDRLKWITADEVQLIMMAVKLARLGRDPLHRDSQVDLAGYCRTLEMTQEKRAEVWLHPEECLKSA
jgi:hypothetical protein